MIVVHADQTCLQGIEPPYPGGAACLIEYRTPAGIVRHDLWTCSPDAPIDRMALAGAVDCLTELARQAQRFNVRYLSTSKYLVEDIAGDWHSTDPNFDLWLELYSAALRHSVSWEWTEDPAVNPKTEYVRHQASWAAHAQTEGIRQSGLNRWLCERSPAFDPDADLDTLVALDVGPVLLEFVARGPVYSR